VNQSGFAWWGVKARESRERRTLFGDVERGLNDQQTQDDKELSFSGGPSIVALFRGERHMRSALLLAMFVLSSQVADAREIRRDSIPDVFRGTWALTTDGCKDGGKDADKSPIVLAARSYAGPAGSCDVDYVMETPGRGGAIYSVRMHCQSAQQKTKVFTNLIIRQGDGGQISLGPTFESLAAHRRCPAAESPK
jgi:hypothetical protein